MVCPIVSVLMSCYNSAAFLPEAIESVLGQTFKDFELILIDDCSTDNTLDIIMDFASKDDRVVFYKQKTNVGAAGARNIGIEMSKGKWIAVLDSDDVALPMRLESQLSYVSKQPDIVLLGSGCVEMDVFGETIKEHYYPVSYRKLVRGLEKNLAFPPHSSCLYNAKAIKRLKGFNCKFVPSEDKDLWLRLSEIGRIACLPEILIKVRKHEASISYDPRKNLGIAATVCYFLRKKKVKDPSAADKQTWESFIAWLTAKLEEEKVFETAQLWKGLRKEWYTFPRASFISKGFKLTTKLVKSGRGFDVVKQKIFGQRIAFDLAEEWIKIK